MTIEFSAGIFLQTLVLRLSMPVAFLELRLKHVSNQGSVRLFADDCVQYRNKHSLQDCLILQEDLTRLGQWKAD